MSRVIKSRDFKKLQSTWYAKLRDTGFQDIEFNENSPFVKNNHLRTRRRVKIGWHTGGAGLFEAATDYLSGATASRRSDRIHAALFVAGMSAANIASRFGVTLRAVQKQIYGFLALVRKDVNQTKKSEEQTEDSTEQEAGVTSGSDEIDLSGAGADT